MKAMDIIWVKNEDGSYTFTNNGGTANSIYAWYVLNEEGQVIYKTKYSKSPHFIFNLNNNPKLLIKGFVRTSAGEGYHQISEKVSADDVLKTVKYAVCSMDVSESVILSIRKQYLENDSASLPVECILMGDGSLWDVDLTIPVSWECPKITNRSYGFWINGFMFLDGTYMAYCDTKNETYAKAIMAYTIDWARQNIQYDSNRAWVWHDHATARRVLRMSFYYYEFRNLCSEGEQKLIEESLEYQAGLLMTDGFYKARHNHGMHQDIALLVYALLLGNRDKKEFYISTAINRIGVYLDYVYTKEGIHKEHSPYYARDIFGEVVFLKNFLENISPDFSNHIKGYMDGTQEYLIQITKPNGMWPSLGDSAGTYGAEAMREISSFNWEDNAEYLWITSDGSNGVMPANEYIAPGGGYSVFRSSWEDEADKATWMMFVASTFSSTHKHGDDLEVLLYHKGDIFVEAGKRNYNYSEEMTAWAYSGYAHNVLLINGEAYPVKIGENGFQSIYPEALDTGITGYELGSDVVSVTGRENRFTNVEQERTLSYDKKNGTATISDVLEADENFEGTLLYHLAEGIEAEQNTDGWNLYRDNELVAVVSIAGDVDFEVDMVNGQGNEYPYCTWIFNGSDSPEYGSLLKINIFGKVGSNKIETIVNLK